MTVPVLAAFAHPDDDTFGIGGTLALLGDRVEVTVVMATSGDAGRIADPSLATRETLAVVREAEDLAAWQALGIEADVRFLRHADGALDQVPLGRLAEQIGEAIAERRPRVVVTFGPDGITGHADHVAIGAAATQAFHAARGSREDPPERLLHVAIANRDLDRLNELLRERGLEPIDPTQPFMPRGVPDDAIGMRVDCADAFDRKVEALRAHKTQGELEDMPFDLWPEMLCTESFVQAWPERPVSEPVLTGLLDGLAAS